MAGEAEKPGVTGRTNGVLSLGEIGLDSFAPYLMNRVVQRWNGVLADALRASGVNTAVTRTLAVLSLTPGCTINELALLTVTEQSTMSRLVDQLEVQGLVTRQTRPADARVREVHITVRGCAVFGEVWPVMHGGYARMTDGITPAELAGCVRVLGRMLANLGDQRLTS